MYHLNAKLRQKGRIGLTITVLGVALAAGVANPASAVELNKPQPLSKADANANGANGQCPTGPYCSTRDGSPSLNGNGGGAAVGKPAAGAFGKADNKNPPGQMPNGSDKNAGYECDRNMGIGRSNPAHTGCTPGAKPPGAKPPGVKPPGANPPGANAPVVRRVELGAPTVVPGTPQVLRGTVVAPAASRGTNPLPTFAAAGEADTRGQLVAGGIAAFAALLALGSGAALRRRYGDA